MTKFKKTKYLILLIVLILASCFFYLDVKSYHYGKGIFNYNLLPFKLIPRDEDWGFTLNDKSDIAIIGEGFVYVNYPEIEIKKILSYGYKSNFIIVKTLGKDNKIYYFTFNNELEPTLIKPDKNKIEIGQKFLINNE